MTQQQVLKTNADGIDEVSFAGKQHIQTPVYSPEIKSYEDLFVLLKYGDALDEGAPIIVPGHTWRSIRSEPKFKNLQSQIRDLVQTHPVIYREPVELFRYRRPKRLVTYALGGSGSRKFYKRLRKHDFQGALSMVPEFFRPFIECQMERLLEWKDIDVPPQYQDTLRSATEAWSDRRANQGYQNYFAEVAKDAQRSPDAAVVPPVPPITSGSEDTMIDRAIGANQAMVDTCRTVNQGHFGGSPVYPYLHVYVDYSILRSSTDIDLKLTDAVRQELKTRQAESSFTDIGDGGVGYQAVVLTISNLQKAWEKNMTLRLERFVENIESLARSHNLPVISPRSGWHGLYLTDNDIQTFSSLLNGNETYSQKGADGGGIGKEARYGTTPFYGEAIDVGVSDAFQALKNKGGSAHPISGLPDSPRTFDPSARSWEDRLGGDEEYRQEFGKARRLIHAQEAREVRQARTRGTSNPAKQYLQRSQHNDFS